MVSRWLALASGLSVALFNPQFVRADALNASAASVTTANASSALGRDVGALLAYARTHSPLLAATAAEHDAALARAEGADALPDPMARIELRDVSSNDRDGGIDLLPARVGATRYTLTQGLPWPGKRGLRRDVADADGAAAAAEADMAWRELAQNVRSTQAMRQLLAERERLIAETVQFVAQLETVATTRYANGIAPQPDVLRAQIERTQLLADLAMLDGERRQLDARLRALLGAPADLPLAPPAVALAPTTAPDLTALTAALAGHPELAVADARIDGAEKSRELTRAERWPDLAVGVSPLQRRDRIASWDVMFELNIPLQQQRRRSDERAAEHRLDATRQRREAVAQNLAARLADTVAGLAAARAKDALLTDRLLPQADVGLAAALAAYENGKVDFATVIDAQRLLRRAREDRAATQSTILTRLAELAALTGEQP